MGPQGKRAGSRGAAAVAPPPQFPSLDRMSAATRCEPALRALSSWSSALISYSGTSPKPLAQCRNRLRNLWRKGKRHLLEAPASLHRCSVAGSASSTLSRAVSPSQTPLQQVGFQETDALATLSPFVGDFSPSADTASEALTEVAVCSRPSISSMVASDPTSFLASLTDTDAQSSPTASYAKHVEALPTLASSAAVTLPLTQKTPRI
mmetsp:Transcript_85718/g.239613  ORF Transcript_85718/g.239613 Transcript_85718/m.239613 type:complete len:207 (+) Transcript_85718:1922-2542(+)